MNYTHVVNGDHAAGVLRAALAAGRDEQVVVMRDDLAVGPLRSIDEDPALRIGFWQQTFAEPDQPRDIAAEFRAEALTLHRLITARDEVVMWHGQSAGDQLALRRLAYHLRNTPQRLNEIKLTPQELSDTTLGPDAATAVAMYPAAALQARFSTIAPISLLRIGRLALEWQELKQLSSDLRRWHDNTFQSGNFSELDSTLLEHAPADWQAASRLLWAAMRANVGFFATDTILWWRCRQLADDGQLQLRGTPSGMLNAEVRRAAP